MPDYPTSCIIGAGPCGITVCKALKERGLPYDCFEMSDDVGGVWYYDNPNGMSSAYRSLCINTSKSVMKYSDYPMPEHFPNYTNHWHIHSYFRGYVEHFGLRDTITFNTGVEHCARGEDGVWSVRLSTGETRRYDFLFVCNGHHWDPRWPEPPFPGHFDGETMHSHCYKTPDTVAGKRVLLVGMGNSAMDIAVEASYVAEKVFLSTRRGQHILPKYLWGRPTDLWVNPHIPFPIAHKMFEWLVWLQQGRVENFGLPRPEHRLLQGHPTISSTILDRIAHSKITPKPNVAELQGAQVRFADGSIEEVDVIIYCTGYKVSFPFFDPEFIAAPDNDLPLYRRMWKPEIPNLAFIGLFQPLGAIFPLAEVQAVLAAEYLRGAVHLPSPTAMRRAMGRERDAMFKRYYQSKRHTMQVDYHPFLHALQRDLRDGQRRAARAGHVLPVAPRAGAAAPRSS